MIWPKRSYVVSDRRLLRDTGGYALNFHDTFAPTTPPDLGWHREALFPDRSICMDEGFVIDPEPEEGQVQAESLELRTGRKVFTMKGDFTSLLPWEVEKYAKSCVELSEGEKATLNPGEIYVVESLERIRMPRNVYGISDARSSVARIGCAGGAATGKNGIVDKALYTNGEPRHVYFKVIPHAFPVVLRYRESRPVQVRFRENGFGPLTAQEIEEEYGKSVSLLHNGNLIPFNRDLIDENGLVLNVSTTGHYYVQKRNVMKAIDITKKDYYDPEEFFERIENGHSVEVQPRRLYLFGSKEVVCLDDCLCGDLVRSPDTLGQGLSNNFARFFGAGFEGEITLEIWNYTNHNWLMSDDLFFGRVLLESLDLQPLHPYRGTYVGQKAPMLPKFFKQS